MKYIKKYDNQASYDVDTTRPIDGSVISMVGEQKIISDGVNVIVPMSSATRGDIALYDNIEKKVKVAKALTFDKEKLDGRYTICDAVAIEQRGDKMLFLYKKDAGEHRWAQGYQVKLEGFDLANGGSMNITLTARPNIENVDVVYPANSTLDSIATLINAVSGEKWKAYTSANGLYLEHNSYTGGVLTINSSSPTITQSDITPKKYQLVESGVQNSYSIQRNKGLRTNYAGCNFDRFIAYHRTKGSRDSNLSETADDILKEFAFNIFDNPILFNKYNGVYEDYIKSEMLKSPIAYGLMGDWEDIGSVLADIMYDDIDGNKKPAYPCAYNVKQNLGMEIDGISGFKKGDYHLPDADELNRIISKIPYPSYDDDIINLGLKKIGGEVVTISNKNYYSSGQHASNLAWYYLSRNGTMYYYSKFGSLYGLGVSALPIEN